MEYIRTKEYDTPIDVYFDGEKYVFINRFHGLVAIARRSKIIMEGAGYCPLTGVCYDCDVLDPLFEYYYNWARPEYRDLTFRDVMERCYDSLFKSVQEEYEYSASDEAVREYLSDQDDYYYENGTKCDGYVYGAA